MFKNRDKIFIQAIVYACATACQIMVLLHYLGCTWIYLGSQSFEGSSGPEGVVVPSGTPIVWSSDGSVGGGGGCGAGWEEEGGGMCRDLGFVRGGG